MPPAQIAAADPAASLSVTYASPTAGTTRQVRAGISWQAIAIAMLLALGELPLLLKFFSDLWSRPQYQFFPIALIAAGYVFWERFREMPADRIERGSSRITALLLALSWLILSAGLLYLRWMAPVSTWLLLAAAVWWAGGARLARAVLPAGILLLIIIPPPAHFDDSLGAHLRVIAVHASSSVLELVSLPHVISGTVIEIPGHRLLVEEACSGINSLMSVLAFTVLYEIWQRRGAWFTTVLTFAAAGFVLCANIARITLGAILVHFWKIDILTGTGHELLGMVLFGVCLGLVISFDRFLLIVWTRKSKTASNAPPPVASKLQEEPRGSLRETSEQAAAGRLLWWPAAVAFLALGVCLQAKVGHDWAQSRLPDSAKFSLPAKLAGWELVRGEGTINGRPETDGLKSNFWVYQSGPRKAAVALDYPFTGFHDATICYASGGWAINRRTELHAPRRAQGEFFQIDMSKAPMMKGELLFAQFDEHGMAPPVNPPVPGRPGSVRWSLAMSRQKAQALPTYQVQTLSIGYTAVSAEEQTALRALFLAAREELAHQLTAQLERSR